MKYIGQHKCRCKIEDDKYLGSGSYFRKAFKEYGEENFEKEILCICQNYDDLLEKEKEYIKKYDAVRSHEFYNVAPGGPERPKGYVISKEEADKIKYLEYIMGDKVYYGVEPVDNVRNEDGKPFKKISIMILIYDEDRKVWDKYISNIIKSKPNVKSEISQFTEPPVIVTDIDIDPDEYMIMNKFIPITEQTCEHEFSSTKIRTYKNLCEIVDKLLFDRKIDKRFNRY